MKVLKIGGSCLQSKEDLDEVARIVKHEKKAVLVCSAFKGITDELILQAKSAAHHGKFDISKIEKTHREALDKLTPDARKKAWVDVEELLSDLNNTLLGIQYLRELSPPVLDKIQSFGERLVVKIVAAYLNDVGVKAKAISDAEGGFITNDVFGNASVPESQYSIIREKLSIPEIPVVAGFVGRTHKGELTTLGRGGTDLTAAIVAAALGCEVVLLKDVAGLMTADPRIVPDAKVVDHINHLDALEVAHYGSKVIFEKAISPAVKAGIPIVIKSFRSDSKGTIIDSRVSSTIIISTIKNVAIVNVLGYEQMMQQFADLVGEFAQHDIYPLILTETSSVGEISLVIEESKLEKIEHILKKVHTRGIVETKKGLALVAVIGSGMKGKIGTAAMIFDSLAANKINVIAIAQSASERNISVVVEAGGIEKAAQALHAKFIL